MMHPVSETIADHSQNPQVVAAQASHEIAPVRSVLGNSGFIFAMFGLVAIGVVGAIQIAVTH